MKSYTDLNQSKKLAEILPLESADMDYIPIVNLEGEYSPSVNVWDNKHEEDWIPCWTLEVKDVDLEKEATEFVQTKEFVESKESPVLLIAKYFFELGLKAKGE